METSTVQETRALSREDFLSLELMKQKKLTALANAEKALAQNEAAELAYANIVLHITIKYNLTSSDKILENGSIVKSE